MSIIDSQEPAYREEHEIDVLTKRVKELEAKSETCELKETETLENVTAHVLECSVCGRTCEHVNGDYTRCPHCGRKVKQSK